MDFFPYSEDKSTRTIEAANETVFLPSWSTTNWDKLLEQTQAQIYAPGDIVIRAGDEEQALYIVAFGRFRVVVNRPKRLALSLKKKGSPSSTTIESGTVINELAFLDGRSSPTTIQAVTECQLFYLNADAFDLFSVRYPELGRDVLRDLGRLLALQVRQMATLLAYQGA